MKSKHWIVIGGGVKGIVGAYLLSKNNNKVTLIDRAEKIGGVLRSEKWDTFYMDKGCHLFDNESDLTTKLAMEIMDNEVVPVNVKYASFVNDQKTSGIAIPNLGSFSDDICKNILWESLNMIKAPKNNPKSLFEHISNIHGETVAEILDAFIKKTHIISSKDVDPISFNLLPYKRIKFLDDKIGRVLKQSAYLDEKIAISSTENLMEFYKEKAKLYKYRNFYPAKNGLTLFCDKSYEKLLNLNVDFKLNQGPFKVNFGKKGVDLIFDSSDETISGDHILWAGSQEYLGDTFGIENDLKNFVHSVPMILYYFQVDKKSICDYSYIHNFNSDDYTFRVSFPTNYNKKLYPGNDAIVCVEVPVKLNSDIWKSPDLFTNKIWRELGELDLINAHKYKKVKILQTPVSYKIPKKGYSKEIKKITKMLPKDIVYGASEWEFSKNGIINSLYKIIQK